MKRKYPESFDSLVDQTISYRTLPSTEELGKKAQTPPSSEIIGHKSGPRIAESEAVSNPIRNAGVLVVPDENSIPNEYEFEILRLRRRVESLECSVRDRDERNVRAIAMLEDELQMWRTFFKDHVAETHDGIRRRILRLDATLMTLRDDNSRFLSPMTHPERWRKP